MLKYNHTLFLLIILQFVASQTTWYVRSDGGKRTECTGTADVAYDPSKNNTNPQQCAFGDWRFLYDSNEYLPNTYNNLTWVISGGDTVIVDNTKQWRVGVDSPLVSKQPFCWGNGGGPYGCFNPAIPAGTASNPTKIFGRNHGNCSIGSGIYTIPDASKLTYLYGGYGASCVLNLGSTQYVQVECLELTSHSICAHHGSPILPFGCRNGDPVLDDYTGNGLCTDIGTDEVSVTDVWTHGHTNSGVQGPMWGNFYATNLRIGVNGECGWNFDDGSHPANGSSRVGLVKGSHVIIEWSGCNQYWTEEGGHQMGYCYDQDTGGYGDGIGTPNIGTMSWICDYCVGLFNTQDAFDLGHVGGFADTTIVFNNSFCYGNMASTYKGGGIGVFEVVNSISVGNCERMSKPIPGIASTFNEHLGLFCRAGGDHLSFNVLQEPQVSNYNVRFNTIIGYNAVVADVQCWFTNKNDPNCGTLYTFNWQNNIELGLVNGQYNNARGPGMWYIITPTDQDHNIFYGLHGCPYMNTTDTCLESNVTRIFNNMIPYALTSEAELDNFDFSLLANGAAAGTGVYISAAYSTDITGRPRNTNNPSLGALEVGSQLKVDLNWWLKPYAGAAAATAVSASNHLTLVLPLYLFLLSIFMF